MRRTIAAISTAGLLLGACASDDAPDEPDGTVPIDQPVDDGVDTNVEDSENLGFDEPDEG